MKYVKLLVVVAVLFVISASGCMREYRHEDEHEDYRHHENEDYRHHENENY